MLVPALIRTDTESLHVTAHLQEMKDEYAHAVGDARSRTVRLKIYVFRAVIFEREVQDQDAELDEELMGEPGGVDVSMDARCVPMIRCAASRNGSERRPCRRCVANEPPEACGGFGRFEVAMRHHPYADAGATLPLCSCGAEECEPNWSDWGEPDEPEATESSLPSAQPSMAAEVHRR
jgi:hypothetical protein